MIKLYVNIFAGMLDIPVYESRVQSLHVLFSLHSAVKNSKYNPALWNIIKKWIYRSSNIFVPIISTWHRACRERRNYNILRLLILLKSRKKFKDLIALIDQHLHWSQAFRALRQCVWRSQSVGLFRRASKINRQKPHSTNLKHIHIGAIAQLLITSRKTTL